MKMNLPLTISILVFIFLFSCNGPASKKTNIESSEDTYSPEQISMDSLKNELTNEIKTFILSGFFNKDETFENIQDMFYGETLDEPWIKKEIDKQYEHCLAEQKTWVNETDFDRLAQVFDKLNSSGIIALHNAGYTRQDGEGDTWQIHESLGAQGIKTRGYCFYHTQDMDRAINSENLLLAFGDFDQNDKVGTDIGNEIITTLHEKGFNINWSGSIEERIEIVGLKWQKRFGNDNCSNDRAIHLLSKD
jgi:hypothetical protein